MFESQMTSLTLTDAVTAYKPWDSGISGKTTGGVALDIVDIPSDPLLVSAHHNTATWFA